MEQALNITCIEMVEPPITSKKVAFVFQVSLLLSHAEINLTSLRRLILLRAYQIDSIAVALIDSINEDNSCQALIDVPFRCNSN